MQGIMENTNQRYEYERYLWGQGRYAYTDI